MGYDGIASDNKRRGDAREGFGVRDEAKRQDTTAGKGKIKEKDRPRDGLLLVFNRDPFFYSPGFYSSLFFSFFLLSNFGKSNKFHAGLGM